MPIASLAEFVDAVAQIVDEWTPPDVDWYLQPWFREPCNFLSVI